ncbi:SMI1/KNR4 family protein [Lacticaseibacillus absianus]|uniref:SMI1/KNR4 family protein n=1 Tax=Lacticaseibacillus absianus TaxID=2729623 RepID=UPI0015CC2EF4|nr:SMI1/KNR4 family protein [Lacticaseibacillus absianus]
MGLRLGNLSIKELENACGFELPEDERDFMSAHNSVSANKVGAQEWHGFDLPQKSIHCGSKAFALTVVEHLKPYITKSTRALSVTWEVTDGE